MDSNLMEKTMQLLNEEKWTRATIKSYSINNFKELDQLIKDSFDDESRDEVLEICEEHLAHSKNSIIALYISGVLSLSRHVIDDSNLMILINIFSDNHKWNIVEYLCQRILDYGENKFALRTLAESYENESETDKKFEIWERLIKVDYDETDIVKHIAEKYEAEGNKEKAIDFYKKAIHRYTNKKLFPNIKELWTKLLDFCPDEIDFFYHLNKKIAIQIGESKACQLLEELYHHYKEQERWNYAIDILKTILAYEPLNNEMRNEIILCFKQKYSEHSQLEEYIKVSNLTQKWRNIHEAIADFEKHISFETGSFIFHRSWGIGRIASIKGDNVVIDFIGKKKHPMSLKMAVNALTMLGHEHIWVYKSIKSKEKLRQMVKENVPWTLKTIIKSFDNSADLKKIKSELVPSILTTGEWTSWSSEAKKVLKTNTDFGNSPHKIDYFSVREKPITFEEKTYNTFKAESDFFKKINTILDFINEISVESDYFPEILQYFINYLKSLNNVDGYTVTSYLLVDKIAKQFPHLDPGLNIKFNDVLSGISDIKTVFGEIEDSEFKKLFLEKVRENTEEWASIYLTVFPIYLNKSAIDELLDGGYKDQVAKMVTEVHEKYKEYRESFVWILKHLEEYPVFERASPDQEKILVNTVHLLDITDREIANRRNVSANKRLNRQISNYLFKENRLENFIMGSNIETIIRMISLLDGITGVDPALKVSFKKKVKELYPDIKFIGIDEELEIVSRGIIVTIESLEKKKRELKNILEVEIPKNSKEIGEAIELGDLRENAEYKAGKEKQELLNIAVGKLKEDIEKCQVFDPSKINITKISFGTKVLLYNNDSGNEETFTILGPWESYPEKNVISYMAPLGSALLGAQENDNFKFTINDRNYDYIITKITKSELI